MSEVIEDLPVISGYKRTVARILNKSTMISANTILNCCPLNAFGEREDVSRILDALDSLVADGSALTAERGGERRWKLN